MLGIKVNRLQYRPVGCSVECYNQKKVQFVV